MTRPPLQEPGAEASPLQIWPWRYEHFSPPVVAEARGRFLQTTEAPQHLGSAPHHACDARSHQSTLAILSCRTVGSPTGRTTNRPHECALPFTFSPYEGGVWEKHNYYETTRTKPEPAVCKRPNSQDTPVAGDVRGNPLAHPRNFPGARRYSWKGIGGLAARGTGTQAEKCWSR